MLSVMCALVSLNKKKESERFTQTLIKLLIKAVKVLFVFAFIILFIASRVALFDDK